MGAVGDIIFHGALHEQAYAVGGEDSPDFRHMWQLVEPHLKSVDLMYGNLEGPSTNSAGFSRDDVGTSMRFNFHTDAISQLGGSGFDIFSTANNHSLDQGSLGLTDTLRLLDDLNIANFGTRSNSARSDYSDTVTIKDVQGIKLAFVNCTFSTNGFPDPNEQVLDCYEGNNNNQKVLDLISSYSQRADIDGVIFSPHWGDEYAAVNQRQKRLGYAAIDAGAMVVIGHHAHVLQEYERYNGKLIFYSLGNFVSNQFPQNRTYQKTYKGTFYTRRHHSRLPRRSSIILYLNIQKDNGVTSVADFKVMPIYMKGGAIGPETSREITRLLGINSSHVRTVVPLYIEKFTGLSESDSRISGLNFNLNLEQLPEHLQSTVRNGAYSLPQNMKLASDVVQEHFPKSLWISEEQVDNPELIFNGETR